MKKLLILFAAICCCGCGEDFSKSINQPIVESRISRTEVNYYVNVMGPDISVIEIEGHLYLVFSGNHKGGIIHAEHCPCKMK